MMYKDKIIVITGGAQGIGKALCKEFTRIGANVCTIDLLANDYFQGDLADVQVLKQFANKVIEEYGGVDLLVNNAAPLSKGLKDCSYEEFNLALSVGVTAPFILTKYFKDYFKPGASMINISSTRDRMNQAQSESYSAAKGGISALTRSLAVTLAGKVRVNSISPGWIDTSSAVTTSNDHLQHLVHRIGKVEDVVEAVKFLASPKAGFITGEDLVLDGGMSKLMIYHKDAGWNYQP